MLESVGLADGFGGAMEGRKYLAQVIISDASRAKQLTKMNQRNLSTHCGCYEY